MNALELAHRYLDIFYNGKDPAKLAEILDANFKFEGPFNKCNSATQYVNTLVKDPPRNMQYQIVDQFGDQKSACVIYLFSKDEIKSNMVQYFRIRDNRISEILLIFDSADFST